MYFQVLSPRVKANREDLNILILGETGVGKSTWINSIANYLNFSSLDDAAYDNASDMMVLISSKFKWMDKFGQVDVKVGDPDDNEKLVTGKSATQYPKVYPFTVNNMNINLIDTPGIGDTDGIDVDKEKKLDLEVLEDNSNNSTFQKIKKFDPITSWNKLYLTGN